MSRLLLLLVTLLFISCEREWTSVAPRHKKYFATMPEPEKPRRWLNIEYEKATVHVAVESFSRNQTFFDTTQPEKIIVRELTPMEIWKLDYLLSSRQVPNRSFPAAFRPRYAIAFWDKDGNVVAHVKFCAEIGTSNIRPQPRNNNADQLRALFESYGFPCLSYEEHEVFYKKRYAKTH